MKNIFLYSMAGILLMGVTIWLWKHPEVGPQMQGYIWGAVPPWKDVVDFAPYR